MKNFILAGTFCLALSFNMFNCTVYKINKMRQISSYYFFMHAVQFSAQWFINKFIKSQCTNKSAPIFDKKNKLLRVS